MKLIYLFSLATLVAANRKACCDAKCYQALEYGDSHDQGNAKSDCKSYQHQTVTVTPCPARTTTTINGKPTTVTVTATSGSTAGKNSSPHRHRRDDGLEAAIEKRSAACQASTSYPSKLPKYATASCKGSDYATACSCLLGSTQKTTTLRQTTTTITSTRISTTTITKSPSSVTTTNPTSCAADYCFSAASFPASFSTIVSEFCEDLIHVYPSTSATAVTVTATATAYSTPSGIVPNPSSTTVTALSTNTITTQCTTTTTVITTITPPSVFPTSVYYVSSGNPALAKRSISNPAVLSKLTQGCPSAGIGQILSSACSCYLQPVTSTSTQTSTVTTTVTLVPTTLLPSVTTSTQTVLVSTTICGTDSATSTIVSTVTAAGGLSGALTCGATFDAASVTAVSTASQIACSPSVPAPSGNFFFRIEGLQSGEGTIFEDCIVAGPRNITTPSGGTHQCDGTNDGANTSPGTTPTDCIDAAARAAGFGYDGSYYSQYQDYFITTISATTQGGTDYWGVLDNLVYTPTGGCQFELVPGDNPSWIFNSFNYNAFLQITPQAAQVPVGTQSITVNVLQTDGNGGGYSPASGANIENGGTSGSNGQVTIPVPLVPGCYQYKALRDGSAPSNAFYLAVV